MSSTFLNDENKGDIVIYQSESGETKIDVRFQDETVWLTQAQMEELFQSSHANMVEHIKNIYSEGELDESSTCRKFRQVRREGYRNVERERLYYNLDMIISLGYRIKSSIATQFRRWATERLKEYMIKGFTMDDERLKNLGGGSYWKELLDRIRDIRSSEKVMYRQVLDLYATSVDYDPKSAESVAFFKMGGGFFVDIHFASGLLASFTYVFERGFRRETEVNHKIGLRESESAVFVILEPFKKSVPFVFGELRELMDGVARCISVADDDASGVVFLLPVEHIRAITVAGKKGACRVCVDILRRVAEAAAEIQRHEIAPRLTVCGEGEIFMRYAVGFKRRQEQFRLRFFAASVNAVNGDQALFHLNFSLISAAFPQLILPSGHGPATQAGPARVKRCGAITFTSASIAVARARISHWARVQQRWRKKLRRARAFIVMIMRVSQAFGRTARASSIAIFDAAFSASSGVLPSEISLAVWFFLSMAVRRS